MKIFIDTADIPEIRKYLEVIDGTTTNPSLILKSGRNFEEVTKEILSIVDGPVSVEVISLDAKGMVDEAKEFSKWGKNVVIKIPMTLEGVKAVKVLSSLNIKTNVTLVFSANQALMAAKAGATYVSPFVGRLDDIGKNGMDLIAEIKQIFVNYNISTEIIVASIRNPYHVKQSALLGADVATIPPSVMGELFKHELTDKGIQKFLKDWEGVKK